MNSNLKKESDPDTQMEKITQRCILCNKKVSEKIFYQWSDPTDNIYGFQFIKSHYRIYGLKSSQYPVKIYIEKEKSYCYLYYNVLCVDCAKIEKERWQCIHCNKYYDNTVSHSKHNICVYCIEKEI